MANHKAIMPRSRLRTVQQLPDELVIEIFSWLPLKPPTRCKNVSKLWSQLITDSMTLRALMYDHFRSRNHTHCSPNHNDPNASTSNHHQILLPSVVQDTSSPAWRLLTLERSQLESSSPSNNDTIKGHSVLPSFLGNFTSSSNICEGLVCFYNVRSLPCHMLSPIFVYSILTQGFTALPTTSDWPFSWKDNLWCCLGFNPARKEYCVLRTTTSETLTLMSSYEVITLGLDSSRSWKTLKNVVVPPTLRVGQPCRKANSLYINGVIYWIHKSSRSNKNLHIAAYDLGREEFRVFDVDELVMVGSYHDNCERFLTSLKGSPTLVFRREINSTDVLQLTPSNNKDQNCTAWSRMFIVPSPLVYQSPPSNHTRVRTSIIVESIDMSDLRYLCCDHEDDEYLVTEIKMQ